MSDSAEVPVSPCRWILPSRPLEYFRSTGQDFFACPEGVYQLSRSEENVLDMIQPMDVEQDSPDIFGVSDIGKILLKTRLSLKQFYLVLFLII
jgi:hypothetical protein